MKGNEVLTLDLLILVLYQDVFAAKKKCTVRLTVPSFIIWEVFLYREVMQFLLVVGQSRRRVKFPFREKTRSVCKGGNRRSRNE
jgi:hypothetical protein